MNKFEIKIIAELMKNSRRSDRELAKAISVSQPTASRIIKKLRAEGLVRECTIIPDFPRIGFSIMAVNFFKFQQTPTKEKLEEARKTARKFQAETDPAVLLVMNGMGMGFDRIVITLHESYSSYARYLEDSKKIVQSEYSIVEKFDSFIVDLCDKTHYLPLTLASLSRHVEKAEKIEPACDVE